MYIKRKISWSLILRYAWPILLGSTIWTCAVFVTYFVIDLKWIDVPFELVGTVGIAVSFFIGFKNAQSYDRFWEGRKIWGAIVNYSRTWANQVLNLITLADADGRMSRTELKEHHRVLIYRHIAWLHALRVQLRQPTSFSMEDNVLIENLKDEHDEGEHVYGVIREYVSAAERQDLYKRKNVATHLVKNQARHLRELKENYGLLDGFDHLMLMKCLEEFYNLQGKCERIKNTPFPRQYAYFSNLFTYIFCALLPLGLLDVFQREYVEGVTDESVLTLLAMVPLSVLVSWMFLTWESVGDNSEDPFENRPNDVPMTALAVTIEIDLKDMLDERDLPAKTLPKDNILY